MKLDTTAVHAGFRQKPDPGIPVTTPIYTAASYFYETTDQLDRVFGRQEAGSGYSRWGNPTSAALEEVLTALESGHGSLACASGMAALQIALTTALEGRPKSILAADALYGATIGLMHSVFEPFGVSLRFADACDLPAFRAAAQEARPGVILVETVSNPLLRVPALDEIAAIAREAGAALVVDNTFGTPMLVRPLEWGAHLTVHSLTKYLSGHGDVLGGAVISDQAHFETLRRLARACGPVLGPVDCYLALRGIKTFPLRMERHCANANRVVAWLAANPKVERVYFPGDPQHPDAATVGRLFPANTFGGMVSFEIRGADRAAIFRFLDRLKMIVPAASLGDVHSLILYPMISSHREVEPRHRERMGIRENLVRLSTGIEAVEDIIADLEQAL